MVVEVTHLYWPSGVSEKSVSAEQRQPVVLPYVGRRPASGQRALHQRELTDILCRTINNELNVSEHRSRILERSRMPMGTKESRRRSAFIFPLGKTGGALTMCSERYTIA